MYRNKFQSKYITILYSLGAKPLGEWGSEVHNGHIKRVADEDIHSLVLEIMGRNVTTTYITCPSNPKCTLGIKLPFLVMIVKNLCKYFTFEIQILDDRCMRRRFRVSNYQTTTRVKPFSCCMPIGLNRGWNQIQFNLADFTRRAYGTNYIEVCRIQVHANCRLRRIYFSDRLYADSELPADYKLYVPIGMKPTKHVEEKKKSDIQVSKGDYQEEEEYEDEGEGEVLRKGSQSQRVSGQGDAGSRPRGSIPSSKRISEDGTASAPAISPEAVEDYEDIPDESEAEPEPVMMADDKGYTTEEETEEEFDEVDEPKEAYAGDEEAEEDVE